VKDRTTEPLGYLGRSAIQFPRTDGHQRSFTREPLPQDDVKKAVHKPSFEQPVATSCASVRPNYKKTVTGGWYQSAHWPAPLSLFRDPLVVFSGAVEEVDDATQMKLF
jgi:hypothetical protein